MEVRKNDIASKQKTIKHQTFLIKKNNETIIKVIYIYSIHYFSLYHCKISKAQTLHQTIEAQLQCSHID